MTASQRDPGRVVAIVQARMTSTRLPGKVLADLCGRPALAALIARTRQSRLLDAIVVATTVNATDDPLAGLCAELGVPVYRGDEADVLGRYREAAAFAEADTVVRITGDCPMIDPGVIDQAIAMYAHGDWDYVSNCNIRTYPDGLDVEVFSRAALEEADREANHAFLREHVTPYIRGTRPEYGSGAFKVGQLVFDADFGHIRWTLDTADDLQRIRRLVSALGENYTWLQALSVATREPDLLGLPPGNGA